MCGIEEEKRPWWVGWGWNGLGVGGGRQGEGKYDG